MYEELDADYTRGAVVQFDDRRGYGLIRPDEASSDEPLYLFHRASLRVRGATFAPGERVLFAKRQVPSGVLAVDVHPEAVGPSPLLDGPERVTGTISTTRYDHGFGFVRLDGGREAFFHVSYLTGGGPLPPSGTQVTCRIVVTRKGIQAQDVAPECAAIGGAPRLALQVGAQSAPRPSDPLPLAVLARDNRQYDEAVRLYEEGLRTCPTIALVLSYAAMEKNRNRKREAMRVYEKGIDLFPRHSKLREDAGMLAASLRDFGRALALFQEALDLCRRSDQGGEKGVLLGLARTHYSMDSIADLKECSKYYGQALQLFARGETRLPETDVLAMNLAKIRTQHHRGNLTFRFLGAADFQIIRAKLLEQTTVGADFVVTTDNAELVESFGISGRLLVRCLFKADVTPGDLADLDAAVLQAAERDLIDEQLTLLILSSVPDYLQKQLFRRLEDRERSSPAIIPLPQSDLETSPEPRTALRELLARWLYRRDLFVLNTPVVGRRFFGRGRPLAELRDAIASGTTTGVFGLRKVGKTSLMKETARRATDAGDIVVYIDLLAVPADVADCRWLYWRIASDLRDAVRPLNFGGLRWRLGGEFGDFLDVGDTFPVATAFDADLSRLLRATRELAITPRPRIALILDEVERLLPNAAGKPGFTGYLDFFSYLRGACQQGDGFVVIISGANAAITEVAQFEGRDNPVFNFFRETYLPFLEQPECALMIRELGRGMGLHFSTDALELIYSLTGGHPFFSRQLCSYLAARNRSRPVKIEAAAIQTEIPQYTEYAAKDFNEIAGRLRRDFPEELAICLELARAGGRLPLEKTPGASSGGLSIRHLVGYQIVKVDGDVLTLTMDLFTQWLREGYALDG